MKIYTDEILQALETRWKKPSHKKAGATIPRPNPVWFWTTGKKYGCAVALIERYPGANLIMTKYAMGRCSVFLRHKDKELAKRQALKLSKALGKQQILRRREVVARRLAAILEAGYSPRKSRCNYGHELTLDNIVVTQGVRICRTCRVLVGRRHRSRVST